jgi:hypothetical protein
MAARQQVAAQEGPTGLAKPLEEQLEELNVQVEELLLEEGLKREDF